MGSATGLPVRLGGFPKQPDNTNDEAIAPATRLKKRRLFFMVHVNAKTTNREGSSGIVALQLIQMSLPK
jgi:hypothetical protein